MGALKVRSLRGASAIYASGSLATKASKFLLIPLYVRFLSQEEVGMLVVLEALMVALGRVMPLGFGDAVKRFYVDYRDEEDADRYTASLWLVGVGLAGACALVLTWLTRAWGDILNGPLVSNYVVLAVLAAFLDSMMKIPLQRHIVRHDPVRNAILQFAQLGLSYGLIIVLVVGFRMGIDGVLWGYVGGYAAACLIAAGQLLKIPRLGIRLEEVRSSLAYGLPLLPHLLFTWGITFSDRLILEHFVPLERVGIYGVGYQLASLLPVISLAVRNAWIAKFFRGGRTEGTNAAFARATTYLSWGLFGVALGLVVLAPEIIALIATPAYAESTAILQIATFGLVGHGFVQICLLPLLYSKRTAAISLATGAGFALNVALNLLLIPHFGIYAAAVATVGSYVSSAVLCWLAVRRYHPVPFEWRRIGAGGAIFVVLAAVGSSWRIESLTLAISSKALFCLIMPIVLMVISGVIRRRELAVVAAFARRWYGVMVQVK